MIMAEKRIFVGRKKELEEFSKVLERPRGEAVLVVGQAGMGKTWLINEMAEIAANIRWELCMLALEENVVLQKRTRRKAVTNLLVVKRLPSYECWQRPSEHNGDV